MRRHRWLATFLGLLLAAGAGHPALAQPPGPPGAGSMPFPGPMGGGTGLPSPYGGPAYGPGYMPPGGMNQSPVPSYYRPWPAVSPFAIDQANITNEDGVWISDLIPRGHNRTTRFRFEFLRGTVQKPEGLIGEDDAPAYDEFIEPLFQNQGGGGGGGQQQQSPLDPFLGNESQPGFNLFDPVDAGFVGTPEMRGLRLTMDVENLDGSGVSLMGFWAKDNVGFQTVFPDI